MTSLIFWDVLEIYRLPRFRASRKGGKPVLNDILKINLQPTIPLHPLTHSSLLLMRRCGINQCLKYFCPL